jgi:6-phosphogluconate dehydrogenase (decarboxylating)
MSKIAFRELGRMGSRMAANLLNAGHHLTVWNREPDVARRLVASGAKAASSPQEVPTVTAVLAVFQKALADNLGDLNMTAVVKLFDQRHPRMQMTAK